MEDPASNQLQVLCDLRFASAAQRAADESGICACSSLALGRSPRSRRERRAPHRGLRPVLHPRGRERRPGRIRCAVHGVSPAMPPVSLRIAVRRRRAVSAPFAAEGPAPGQRRPPVVSSAISPQQNCSGSLAMLAAMRRASSRVRSFAARWPRLHPPRAGALGADR